MVDKIWYNMEELIGGSEERGVLIETYWNVNTLSLNSSRVVVPVLIETYWNVNMKSKNKDRQVFRVLIETYWNVNVKHNQMIVRTVRY